MICRRCKTVRSAKLSRVTNEHGPRPANEAAAGRRAPRVSFHTFSVYIATQTLRSRLARAPKTVNSGRCPAIRVQYSRRGTPIACHWIRQTAQKPRLSMGDRANSITSAHRARRQPRSILLRFALARAFAHTTACSLIVVTESCIAMVPQNGLGIARARGRIWSLGRCVAACRGRRTAPRPGTARNSNVWTLKIFPNVWTLTFCRDLKKFQSPNIDPRQKLFRGRKIRARSREYARPGRLDSNIFWSGWEKFSESKTPTRA
ncbi:unnamed protein product [Clavelina lepadiformis]|uniref:Uncharacterized protein n=1 Tax=Clavelina lepadiformis TaxID=159417 RepID=A0ABP0H166_CLALP